MRHRGCRRAADLHQRKNQKIGLIQAFFSPFPATSSALLQASWFAGIRSRHNSIYKEMLGTIEALSKQNTELLSTIANLQDEVVEVRRENAELKLGQQSMTKKIETLQKENIELKGLIKKQFS